MRRPKVLHVITMLELGGAQRNTLDTVRLLDRERFDVGLACADRGDLLDEARALADAAVFELRHMVRELRPWRDLRAFDELRAVVRSFAPDIVHTHSSKAGILGRAAARLERVPVVIHSIHGFGFGPHQAPPLRWLLRSVERLAARATTAFIAVSQRNLEDAARLGLLHGRRALVIRSGIELSRFRRPTGGEAVRAELGIPPTAPVVLQVACFKPQKAPQRFVRLAARLADRFPTAHFVLVGDGTLRGELERLRVQAGLESRVHLPGWRLDVPAFLSLARVVTLTSRFEGLPRVLVEALAAGVPVVATAVDGVVEVVRDGVNGFLVDDGDEAGLAERVAQVLGDEALHDRLADRACEGLGEFDRDDMVRRQEALYGELMAARGIRCGTEPVGTTRPRSEEGRHA